MEFRIRKSSDNQNYQDSFDLGSQELASIPCPDDMSMETEGSPEEGEEDEDNELLLPPGTTRDEFPDLPPPPGASEDEIPKPLPSMSYNISNNLFPSLPQNQPVDNTSKLLQYKSEDFNILPLSENIEPKPSFSTDELQGDVSSKTGDFLDDCKYSPTKLDSDEENQDSITIKPKVLGKEQAKKRLMAFSLSKLPSVSIKKQSKLITPAKNKEKPPNPNKGSSVQEQFRATISAIEEEKKIMFQNMKGYLPILEKSELVKSSQSLQLLDKTKIDNVDSKSKNNSGKDGSTSNKSSEDKDRSYCRSSSQNKNKKPDKSRGSKSRTRRSRSRSRRKSYSKSRSRRSEEKSDKSENKTSRESHPAQMKKSFGDWDTFKAAGLVVESESAIKSRLDESKSRRDEHHRRSRSPNGQSEHKPIFNYLTKNSSPMTSLQVKPAESGSPAPVFSEKIIKYTRTKPILCWSENPSLATEFYMSQQMLLENCDETIASIVLSIVERRNSEENCVLDVEEPKAKSRSWYPSEDYFMPFTPKHSSPNIDESQHLQKTLEGDEENQIEDKEEEDDGKADSFERKISLVNDSYLSDEEEQTQMTVKNTKVLLGVEIDQVKIRSKWDSDCEGDASEKDMKKNKVKTTDGKVETVTLVPQTKDKLVDDFDVAPCDEIVHVSPVKKKTAPLNLDSSKVPHAESPSLNVFDGNAGNLVSEYEEFLKMVSVDTSDVHDNKKNKVSKEFKKKREKPKVKKSSKSTEEVKKFRSPKLGITDWDEESDFEENSTRKKMQFTNSESYDEFSIPRKSEVMDVTFEKIKKKLKKKKSEKEIMKKKKLFKKSSKAKKKKFENLVSEDESSTESDSDSDSDESISSKSKKRKKKMSKTKKKSKKESSSESDSDDSDDDKEIKKKSVKKKRKKKKSSSSSRSSSSVDRGEVQTTLLKQLDFKKSLIMRKIEEIDFVSDEGVKKKESQGKKMESSNTDSEKHVKTGKKKNSGAKIGKEKKKSKSGKKAKAVRKSKKLKKSKSSSESESDSDSSGDKMKKKLKKSGKRKRYTSESSDSDERVKSKASSKNKKEKSKRDSSVSELEDIDDSSRERKKSKKANSIKSRDGKATELSFKDDYLVEKPGVKPEGLTWDCRKLWKGKNKKSKEGIDWEASSSTEESKEERKTRESSWDEEAEGIEKKTPASEYDMSKTDKKKTDTLPEKESSVNNATHTSDPNIHLSSEALKTSLSNFSFNENSFCSFGQELSRDFFLAERSYSNSGFMGNSDTLIDPRPFQSVSRDSESKKPTDSELYSPGYSDSDLSESEMCEPDKESNVSIAGVNVRVDVYDPLNCDSEGSGENNEVEVSSIPLPHVPNTSFPVGVKNFDNTSSNSEGSVLKNVPRNETDISGIKMPCTTPPPVKSTFTTGDFTTVSDSTSPFADEKITPTKRQVINVKGQQKLVSKAAAVFQDESDEENIEPLFHKEKSSETAQSDSSSKGKSVDYKKRRSEKEACEGEKETDCDKKQKKESRDRSREKSTEKEREKSRKKRSRSRESSKIQSRKTASPKRKRSKTPEMREKREIRSDSFEIEPLKSSMDSGELMDLVQPIPVLTNMEPSSEGLWARSLVPSCDFSSTTDNLIDHAESFDIYPSEETNFWYRNYERDIADRDKFSAEKSRDCKVKKEKRKSRSRSYSPRKKFRSKSPERWKSPRSRSPWRKSISPKRRDKSPFSPRRRSPNLRRYKTSWSPDKRKRSSSRSPRRRRGSPSRRSRSSSPRKYRSPRYRDESPRRKGSSPRNFSPRDRFSPRKDTRYLQTYPDNLQNRIPVIGTCNEDVQLKLSPSAMSFPRHLPDSSVTEPELYSSFYEGEYTDEFGGRTYPEEVGINNLITVQSHEGGKPNSPERLSLDQRIELELGVQMSGGGQVQTDQYQVCPPFQDMSQTHFQNAYTCDNTNMTSENFYQTQNVQMNSDFNGQYFNGHQQQPQPSYGSFQPYPSTQPAQNSVLQVGNIVEVVPMLQQPPPPHPIAPKTPQIMQVGNVLQVVPSPKATPPVSSQGPHTYEASPLVKTQKATAVVAPSPAAPTPNPEAALNPLIKAIQLEREKRKKEKENRRAEREARRKARQLRREAKLLSVNEKLKKSVQDEGLMLGQEVEDEELLDGLDVPSPPIPVEIITVSTISALPPAGKGILITAGFMPKPPSEKKEVKFADGVCPGEGTSTSGGEEITSPPPKPKLPKEKRFKKKKTKVKKKVKVQIIRQIIQEDDDEDDDLSPPPPPPGDPPLVFFAKFPFANDTQFPVYQTQTTTTTLTTVQYPAQTFE